MAASSVGRLGVTLLVVACSGAPPNTETARPRVEPVSAPDAGDAAPASDDVAADGGPSDAQKELLLADPDDDGLPNAEDRCPYDPGPRRERAKHNGCPWALSLPDPAPYPGPLNFPEKSATISPGLSQVLDGAARYLLDHPRKRVLVVGHSEWGESRNLAGARARAFVDYFVSRGLSPDRFDLEARPAKEPVRGERTPSARDYDRRVELRLLSEEGSAEP